MFESLINSIAAKSKVHQEAAQAFDDFKEGISESLGDAAPAADNQTLAAYQAGVASIQARRGEMQTRIDELREMRDTAFDRERAAIKKAADAEAALKRIAEIFDVEFPEEPAADKPTITVNVPTITVNVSPGDGGIDGPPVMTNEPMRNLPISG